MYRGFIATCKDHPDPGIALDPLSYRMFGEINYSGHMGHLHHERGVAPGPAVVRLRRADPADIDRIDARRPERGNCLRRGSGRQGREQAAGSLRIE